MRLLIAEDGRDLVRLQRVTGLGRGVDAGGELSEEAVARTVAVLAEYGDLIRSHGAEKSRAVATSASRDAANASEFLEKASSVLGFSPEVISGEEEATLSFMGATSDLDPTGSYLVSDIGGGSTEFVWMGDGGLKAVSLQAGSVRLTDRYLESRPVDFDVLERAVRDVAALFESVEVPTDATVVGVAGTWTSLSAISLGLESYDPVVVHHSVVERLAIDRLVERLASLTIEETASIPALDPDRAPVILGGALVAREVMRRMRAQRVLVSERDLLDGIVAGLAE